MPYDEITTKELLKHARYKGEVIFNIISIILSFFVDLAIIYVSYELRTNPNISKTIADFTGIDIAFIKFLSIFNSYAIIVIMLGCCILMMFYNYSYATKAKFINLSIDELPNCKCLDLYNKYCDMLDITEKPVLFFNNKIFDSTILGVKIRGKKAIGINAKAFQDVSFFNDYHSFNYQVCSTLGSIYLGHYDLLFQLFTFWARLIPFYNKAYSQALCYSTDRVAQILSGTTPLVTSICRETSGLAVLNDELIESIITLDELEMTKLEKRIATLYGAIEEYPLPYSRITKILNNDIKDKEFVNNTKNGE